MTHSLCFPPRHQTYLPKCLNSEVFKGYTFNGLKFKPNLFEFLLFENRFLYITPFAVHYEKIRFHLRETATNNAKIHLLARKRGHLRINQIQ